MKPSFGTAILRYLRRLTMKNQTEKTYCSHCGELIDTDDYELINGSIVCSDCVEMHTVVCNHCNERIFISASVQDDDISLCQSCYDEYYHTCENCGRIIHSNSTNWRGDYPYCDSCYDDFSDEIEEYNYKPEPIFYGEGKRFFDVRRWKVLDSTCKQITAMKITKDGTNLKYERYAYPEHVCTTDKYLLYPFNESEVQKMQDFTKVDWQNPGW